MTQQQLPARVRVAAIGDIHLSKTAHGSLQPLVAQISSAADVLALCGDFTDYGLPEEARVLARELTALGVDAIHVSSGGFDGAGIRPGPLYQVPLSAAVRESGAKTIAVGLINDPHDAEHILKSGEADLVAFARGALEDPNWAIHAHHVLDGAHYDLWPRQARDRIRAKDHVLGLRQ